MRAATYTRVSSEEQVKGHSLDGQRAILEAWAERESWELVAHYEDAGFSAGTIEGRPAFMQMLAEAAAFDVLLVLKQDRFARDIADAFMAERALQRAGARVLYHDEPGANDSDSPAGLIVKAVGYAGAQGYRMDLSRKIARGYETMATRKGLHVGDVPFGYCRPDPKQPMTVDEGEAEAVRWAFETYATGNTSYMQVADELARRGHRPHSKRGRQTWALSTVSSMLKNRVYLGEVLYRGEYYPGAHDRIISDGLFARVQSAAATRKRAPRTYHAPNHFYLLSGFSGCAQCDSSLWADTAGSGYRYYRCSSRHSRAACRDQGRGIRAEVIEDRVERAIVGTAARVTELDALIVDEIERTQPLNVEQERARLEHVIRRATKLMLAGGDEVTAIDAITDARRRLASLEHLPEAGAVTSELVRFGDLWLQFTGTSARTRPGSCSSAPPSTCGTAM